MSESFLPEPVSKGALETLLPVKDDDTGAEELVHISMQPTQEDRSALSLVFQACDVVNQGSGVAQLRGAWRRVSVQMTLSSQDDSGRAMWNLDVEPLGGGGQDEATAMVEACLSHEYGKAWVDAATVGRPISLSYRFKLRADQGGSALISLGPFWDGANFRTNYLSVTFLDVLGRNFSAALAKGKEGQLVDEWKLFLPDSVPNFFKGSESRPSPDPALRELPWQDIFGELPGMSDLARHVEAARREVLFGAYEVLYKLLLRRVEMRVALNTKHDL